MADQHLSGVSMGVRDCAGRGMQVRLMFPATRAADGQLLEPAAAAELGRALIAQADEAILAEQAKRRSTR